MGSKVAVNGLINVGNVGSDISIVQETALGFGAEFLGVRGYYCVND